MSNPAVHILLVEDDEIDAEAVQRAFRKHRIANPITVAANGLIALEILRSGKIPRPNLILLDINMPRMNGIQFLQTIRQDENLRDLVVFVLTTSDDDRDKVATYDQNIAGYLVKSKVGDGFVNLVEMLDCYWRYVEFPPAKR